MPSLLELKEQVLGAKLVSVTPTRPRRETPQQAKLVQDEIDVSTTDEIVEKIDQEIKPEELQEQAFASLFTDSWQRIKDRMLDDKTFRDSFKEKSKGLKGIDQLNLIIDEADEMRFQELELDNPQRANAVWTGIVNFVNSGTFGQAARLQGLGISLQEGIELDEGIKRAGEEIRILQKKFPKASFIGSAAALFPRGSQAGAALSGVSSLAMKEVLKRVAGRSALKNTNTLNAMGKATLTQKVLAGGAGGTAAAGTFGAVSGFLGEGNESIASFERAADQAVGAGMYGAIFGSSIPVGVGGLKKVGQLALAGGRAVGRTKPGQKLSSMSSGVNERFGEILEGITGVPEKVLRANAIRGKEIRSFKGTDKSLGEDLVERIVTMGEEKLPSLIMANKLLHRLPPVDLRPLISYLRKIPKSQDPSLDIVKARGKEWADNIVGMLPRGVKLEAVPPGYANRMKQLLQEATRRKRGFEKVDIDEVTDMLKTGAHVARMTLLSSAAKEGSRNGRMYRKLMERGYNQLKVITDIDKQFGNNPDKKPEAAAKMFRQLFGTTRGQFIVPKLRAFDAKFRTDFIDQAELWFLKKNTSGESGLLKMLPTQPTGRSLLGIGLGVGVNTVIDAAGRTIGGPAGQVLDIAGDVTGFVTAALSSPRGASAVLGNVSKMDGLIQRVLGKPQLIKQAASILGLPKPVTIALKGIDKSLNKDGAASAAGLMDLLGETPVAVGLAHAIDLAERKSEEKEKQEFLSEQRRQRIEAAQ